MSMSASRCRGLGRRDDGLENAADFGLEDALATVYLWP